MPSEAIDTVQLQRWINRMHAGDTAAREELLQAYFRRLEQLTRKLLRTYPGVQRWEQTGDVLHPALIRLLRALEEVRPDSTRAFMALAALQIRRELLNLSERHGGPHGIGANHDSAGSAGTATCARPDDPPASSEDARELERWTAFHRAVETLPDDEREIVSLLFYHGVTKGQAADMLGVTERTVRRRWVRTQLRLKEFLKEADTAM